MSDDGTAEIEFTDDQIKTYGRMFMELFSEDTRKDKGPEFAYGAACLAVVQEVLDVAFTEWGIGEDSESNQDA